MLSSSADERLAVLQGFVDSIAAAIDESARDKDLAVLPILRRTIEESKK